jgi:hypothetical protein
MANDGASGWIVDGASVGGPDGGAAVVAATAGFGGAGARGISGGVGGKGAAKTKTDGVSGNVPVMSSGVAINSASKAAWTRIESGTVYHRFASTRADGRTISVNISAIGSSYSSQR